MSLKQIHLNSFIQNIFRTPILTFKVVFSILDCNGYDIQSNLNENVLKSFGLGHDLFIVDKHLVILIACPRIFSLPTSYCLKDL